MKSQADLQIARHIRRVMVRHWIDLGRMSIRSQGGRIMIYGMLQRIAGVNEALTTPIVEAIFQQIKKIKGVRSTSIHLDNWTNKGGMWRPVEDAGEAQDSKPRTKMPTAGKDSKSFTMVNGASSSDK